MVLFVRIPQCVTFYQQQSVLQFSGNSLNVWKTIFQEAVNIKVVYRGKTPKVVSYKFYRGSLPAVPPKTPKLLLVVCNRCTANAWQQLWYFYRWLRQMNFRWTSRNPKASVLAINQGRVFWGGEVMAVQCQWWGPTNRRGACESHRQQCNHGHLVTFGQFLKTVQAPNSIPSASWLCCCWE